MDSVILSQYVQCMTVVQSVLAGVIVISVLFAGVLMPDFKRLLSAVLDRFHWNAEVIAVCSDVASILFFLIVLLIFYFGTVSLFR